jgi:hypothetical protein
MKILRCEKVPIYPMLTVQCQTVDTMTNEFGMIVKTHKNNEGTETATTSTQIRQDNTSTVILLPQI